MALKRKAKSWVEAGKAENKAALPMKYLEKMKSALSSPIPVKHKNHPESYQAFLKNEIRLVSARVEYLKMAPEASLKK
jgi:hypothetical protein